METTMAAGKRTDFAAALTGMVVGGCVLFVVLFTIVQLTNRKYAHEATAAATAPGAAAVR